MSIARPKVFHRRTWLRARGRTSNDYQPLVDGSDGRLTILPNGSLWTASAGPQDEDYYFCRANNGIGSGLSKVIYMSMHGKNTVTVTNYRSINDKDLIQNLKNLSTGKSNKYIKMLISYQYRFLYFLIYFLKI